MTTSPETAEGAGAAAPFEDPGAVLDWLLAVRRARQTPNLVTYVSSAVQLCRVAAGRGVELEGVRLSVIGEPITATRLATIRRAGAEAVPYYGSVEAGLIGTGCLRPAAPDDVHIQHDLVALVQPGEGVRLRSPPTRSSFPLCARPPPSRSSTCPWATAPW